LSRRSTNELLMNEITGSPCWFTPVLRLRPLEDRVPAERTARPAVKSSLDAASGEVNQAGPQRTAAQRG
jgi:hypothetical protein